MYPNYLKYYQIHSDIQKKENNRCLNLSFYISLQNYQVRKKRQLFHYLVVITVQEFVTPMKQFKTFYRYAFKK